VNLDFQVRVTGAIEGVTSPGGQFLRAGGGKAANVAYLARRLGVDARLIACAGDDDLREPVLRPLRETGVDLCGVTVAARQATGVAMIAVRPEGTKSIVVATNANDAWTDGQARSAADAIATAPKDAMLVADYEVPNFVAGAAIEAARARGLPVIIDPSFPDRVERRFLPSITAITPDATEARVLTGTDTGEPLGAACAAKQLAAFGVPIVCVKLSDGGCVLADSGSYTLIPSLRVKRIDSTGAGDAFAGALRSH
jgi:ribokinase